MPPWHPVKASLKTRMGTLLRNVDSWRWTPGVWMMDPESKGRPNWQAVTGECSGDPRKVIQHFLGQEVGICLLSVNSKWTLAL